MQISYDPAEEIENRRKHRLSLELAWKVFDDPLVAIVYDRLENGEHRYYAIGIAGWTCLLVVHTYPDPDDESWIQAIGLREATPDERKRYEKGGFD